jgi:transcriptional regulator with XRE-family HTH domain
LDERLIVKKIKEFRLSRNISLDKLANLTGLTKGYLSRIENSAKSPPVSTLAKISQGLGVDITQFFFDNLSSPQPVDISIVKRNERLEVGGRGTPYGYIYEALAHKKPGKNMEPYIITIGSDRTADFQHEGEEFLFVIEGRLEHFYKGERYILEEGDSVYFDANIPHSGRSLGNKKAKLLMVIYSYKRI